MSWDHGNTPSMAKAHGQSRFSLSTHSNPKEIEGFPEAEKTIGRIWRMKRELAVMGVLRSIESGKLLRPDFQSKVQSPFPFPVQPYPSTHALQAKMWACGGFGPIGWSITACSRVSGLGTFPGANTGTGCLGSG
jgi:hypothetical protein